MAGFVKNVVSILRGLEVFSKAYGEEQFKLWKRVSENSSICELLNCLSRNLDNSVISVDRLQFVLKDSAERGCAVAKGLNLFFGQLSSKARYTSVNGFKSGFRRDKANISADLDISTITLKELEEILRKHNKDQKINIHTPSTRTSQFVKFTKLLRHDRMLSLPLANPDESEYVANSEVLLKHHGALTIQKNVNYPELISVAKQRRVPSSRLGRMASFGSLFAGLSVGTINELTKGILGFGGSKNVRDAILSPANAERIVDTLCKVRGAALKIGQILSIQDANVVSPQLVKAFERVRQAADYMPDWQVYSVLQTELGTDWRDMLRDFDIKPFAAASIGQVHRATLRCGMRVAIKIQYPGVAQSIESDIDNLVGVLKMWDIFPHGVFIDNVVKVAKHELNWEVDYVREAEYTEKFKVMIAHHPEYYVPMVIKKLTTPRVLTSEFVPGIPLDKCFHLSDDHRQHIAKLALKLCLRELFELRCMQTDPNWSNFLYNVDSKILMLIDFGSTRFYQKDFIKSYRNVIVCAVNNNREGVLRISRQMGFLTGYETKQMEEAHVNAVMILGEIFRFNGEFDFGKQNTTERIAKLVPTMVSQRLCPPPEEIYSIHRKLSGIFLLCSRLNVKIDCRPLYKDIILHNINE